MTVHGNFRMRRHSNNYHTNLDIYTGFSRDTTLKHVWRDLVIFNILCHVEQQT